MSSPGVIRSVFALDGAEPIRLRTILIAALGMGVPLVVGWALGRLDAGLTIGLGAILLAGAAEASSAASPDGRSAIAALVPALLAALAATAIGGASWSDPAMIALASLAALLSGYSRPLAVAAIRFAIYLVLSVGFLDGAGGHRGDVALVFGLGAMWNIALRWLLARHEPVEAAPPPGRVPTRAQRTAHFRKTLRTLAGWQFPLRMGAGLGIGSVVRHGWPAHHFYWIMLTVALLTQRAIEHVPVKTVQRLLGTFAGVGLAWAILAEVHGWVMLAGAACVLAAIMPVARTRSYLLYAIVVTPLILLVLDLGRPIAPGLLVDRLVATFIGGGIVIAGNVVLDRVMARSVR
jgi:cytochrome c oxidase subunit IV